LCLAAKRKAQEPEIPCPVTGSVHIGPRHILFAEKTARYYTTSMSAPVELRIAALEARDADAVSALESACFTTAFSPEQYRRILQAPPQGRGTSFLGLGLFAPGRVLLAYALVGLHRAAREAEVYNLAVRGSVRRRGFGAALLACAVRALESSGIERVLLEAREGNQPALALYAAQGFESCGRRRGYYADTGEDALVLHLCIARRRTGQKRESYPCPLPEDDAARVRAGSGGRHDKSGVGVALHARIPKTTLILSSGSGKKSIPDSKDEA
jgi:ribosomal-protein-alanine N-acetyltransferase